MSRLPQRRGPRPRTTPTNPHTQLDQRPSPAVIAELGKALFALPGVVEQPSAISVPGARALWLDPALAQGPRDAFLTGREFAHLHPMPDGSLHVALPRALASEVIAQGWAEVHPVARLGLIPENVVMLYAPRDAGEAAVVLDLVRAASAYARGERL
jgi:luciferase-like monooxygenase